MKKLLAATAVAALVAGSSFAIDAGFWCRGIWTPVKASGDTYTSTVEPGWGGYGIYQSYTLSASADSYGVGLKYDNGNWKGNLWAKPIDQVKLTIGTFDEDTGRLGFGYGGFNWVRYGAMADGDDLFFTQTGSANAAVVVTPVNNLWAKAAFYTDSFDFSDSKFINAETVYKTATYGAGYTMDGLGSVAVQYVGGNTVNAAVTFSAVDNLWAAAGVFVPTADASKSTIAAGATYTVNGITAHGYGKVVLGDTPVYNCGAGADFPVVEGINGMADIRYTSEKNEVSAAVAVSKGVLGVGFEADYVPATDATKAVFSWCVPVKIELSF